MELTLNTMGTKERMTYFSFVMRRREGQEKFYRSGGKVNLEEHLGFGRDALSLAERASS